MERRASRRSATTRPAVLSTSKAGSQEQAMTNLKTVAKILLALTLTVGLLQLGCSDSRPTEVKAAPRPPANVPATTTSVPAPDREPFFIASGPLIVEHQVDVAAQRDGLVAEIHAEPGLMVRAGQILAQLDDREATADLNAAGA